MPDFLYDPPLDGDKAESVAQSIRMSEGSTEIAVARWHASEAKVGVVQILDFQVHMPHRRTGFGKRLLAGIIEQALAWHRMRNSTLRRIWVPLRQKQQVIARAFFVQNGFTHVGTIRDLMIDEDVLVYFRTFD